MRKCLDEIQIFGEPGCAVSLYSENNGKTRLNERRCTPWSGCQSIADVNTLFYLDLWIWISTFELATTIRTSNGNDEEKRGADRLKKNNEKVTAMRMVTWHLTVTHTHTQHSETLSS